MKQFIKKYGLVLVAFLTIFSFSAFSTSSIQLQEKRMIVALYFHGNPCIASQVEDESLWTTAPNGLTCDNVNHKACMLLVEHTDLTPMGTLDSTKIILGSINTGAGYIPTRIGGTSATVVIFINRS